MWHVNETYFFYDWLTKNLQQSSLPPCRRQLMCNLFRFWQNSISWKWVWSCHAWVIFRAFVFVLGMHCADCALRPGCSLQLSLNKRKNKSKSPTLITQNLGNFLCVLWRNFDQSESCLQKNVSCHLSHLTELKLPIKVGGKLVKWMVNIVLKTKILVIIHAILHYQWITLQSGIFFDWVGGKPSFMWTIHYHYHDHPL